MTSIDSIYQRILKGVSGPNDTAGIRITATYAPALGPGSKIYPPTFPVTPSPEWKRYLVDSRFDSDGNSVQVVLVDSIQSQANRLEAALQDALDAGDVSFPVLDLVFPFDGRDHHITNLVAPHRGVDAYFRDAERDGVDWESTPLGKELLAATARTARPLFRQTPTDLFLGHWDSQRGKQRSRKIARSYSSEMFGLNPQIGRSAAVRIDPYEVSSAVKVSSPKGSQAADWVFVGEGGKGDNPSKVNLGSVPSTDDGKEPRTWVGTSVTAVDRVGFISFAALQRFSFPDAGADPDRSTDAAGRAVLAALALYGDRRAFASAGLFLRSGCDLVLRSEAVSFLSSGEVLEPVAVSVADAAELVKHAVAQAEAVGLTFADSITLQPKAKLVQLVEQSMHRVGGDDEGDK